MSMPLFSPVRVPEHLAAQLCARVEDPPQTEIARKKVMEQIELVFGEELLTASAQEVGIRSVEVYSKSPIPRDAAVLARVWGGDNDWSRAVVKRCVETVGGWKIELRFGAELSRGSC